MRYENAKFHSENFYSPRVQKSGFGLPDFATKCYWRKMGVENQYFIQNTWSLSLSKVFFHFQRKGEQENVRFIVNQDTVLNIIPVDL
jgi:hypothetical protein